MTTKRNNKTADSSKPYLGKGGKRWQRGKRWNGQKWVADLPFGWLTKLHRDEPSLRPFIEAEHAARVVCVEAVRGGESAAVVYATDSPRYLAVKAAESARHAAQDRLNMERLRQLA